MSAKPRIFLSYSRVNRAIADEIDNSFKAIGITFVRDVRDIGYKDSIKEFMKRVRKTDYVIVLLSDAFLKSEYCMFEILELVKDEDFAERTLQIVLTGAEISKAVYRTSIKQYWKEMHESLETELGGLDLEEIGEESKTLIHYRNIRNSMDTFLSKVKDQNHIGYDQLRDNGFKEILDYVGYSDRDLKIRLLTISNIDNHNDRELAIDSFILENPNYAEGYIVKAFFSNNPKLQVFYYTKVLELDSEISDAYLNRSAAKAATGDQEGAIADVEKAIALNPEDALAHYGRGCSRAALEDYVGAIKDYNRAIALDSEFVQAYYNRANSRAAIKDYVGASDDLNKVIKFNPEDGSAYMNRGWLNAAQGNHFRAISDYYQAINLGFVNAEVYLNRGNSMVALNNNIEAILDYDMAIALHPEFIDAYLNRARIKAELGQDEGAAADFKRADEIMGKRSK